MQELSLHIMDIAENGIAAGATLIEITLTEDIKANWFRIQIRDNGRGISPQRLKMLPVRGHALSNVMERLKLHYKNHAQLTLNSVQDQETTVTIELPKEFR